MYCCCGVDTMFCCCLKCVVYCCLLWMRVARCSRLCSWLFVRRRCCFVLFDVVWRWCLLFGCSYVFSLSLFIAEWCCAILVIVSCR